MKKLRILAVLLALILAACGGDTDSSDSGDDTQQPTDQAQASDDQGGDDGEGAGAGTEMDPNFDLSQIPDDFPSELLPDDYTAGFYAELGSIRNVNFHVARSFDDVIADYTDRIGEPPILAEGEERLASWTVDGEWAVSVIEDNPTLIGIAHSG